MITACAEVECINGIGINLEGANFYQRKQVVAIRPTSVQEITFCDHNNISIVDKRHVLLADPATSLILNCVSQYTLNNYFRNESAPDQPPPLPSAIMAFQLGSGQELLFRNLDSKGIFEVELTRQNWLIANASSGFIVGVTDQLPDRPIDPHRTNHIYRDDLVIRAQCMNQDFSTCEQGHWGTGTQFNHQNVEFYAQPGVIFCYQKC